MRWLVKIRPDAEDEILEAAQWYEDRCENLGDKFVEEIIAVLDALAENPMLSPRRALAKDIRWRYPEHFPFTVIYEIVESDRTVIVAAVLHAVRDDRHWRNRF